MRHVARPRLSPRWLLACLAVLLLATGGALAWSSAQRGYPSTVYYSRLAIATGSPYWGLGGSPVIEEWIDPPRHRDRIRIEGLGAPIDRVMRDGHAYDGNEATRSFFAGSAGEQWVSWLVQQGCAGVSPARASAVTATTLGAPVQFDIGSGYTATARCARYRFEPGALPSSIFDPPRSRQSLWDALHTWLTGHLRGNP